MGIPQSEKSEFAAIITVLPSELEAQYHRLTDLQYTLGYLQEVTLQMSDADQNERLRTSVLALASEAAERAHSVLAEEAIRYSQSLNKMVEEVQEERTKTGKAKS